MNESRPADRPLFQDRSYCIGELPALEKLQIVLGLLRHPGLLLVDRLKLRRQVLYETKTGIRFAARAGTTDINEALVLLSGREYPPLLLNISAVENPVVMDCGAHIGLFTLFVKTLNASARVYAIEPVPQNLRLLEENLRLNGIAGVTIVGKALHSRSGDLALYVNERDFDMASTAAAAQRGAREITVAATTLPDLLRDQRIAAIDLLKMDVEGSEYEIVDSAFAALSEKAKRIVFEYHLTAEHPLGRDELVSRFGPADGFRLIYETKNLLGFQNTRFG
jgi:FkbM family methyltransferase